MSKEKGFIFTELNSISCKVEYLEKADDYPIALGVLTKRHSSNQWYISKIGSEYHPRNNPQPNLSVRYFESREQAADFLLYLQQVLDANPLSTDVKAYLEDQVGQLGKELEEANGRFYSIQRKRGFLAEIANKHGLKFEFDGDVNKEIQELLEFVDKDIELIYEHFGKDWARSFRSRLESVVKCVNPLASINV